MGAAERNRGNRPRSSLEVLLNRSISSPVISVVVSPGSFGRSFAAESRTLHPSREKNGPAGETSTGPESLFLPRHAMTLRNRALMVSWSAGLACQRSTARRRVASSKSSVEVGLHRAIAGLGMPTSAELQDGGKTTFLFTTSMGVGIPSGNVHHAANPW